MNNAGKKPPVQAVRLLNVSEEAAGQRVDNFLLRELKGVPKSRIYRLLRKGEVRVNRGRVRPEYRLAVGDQLRIPPVRVAERGHPPPQRERLRWLDEAVLFEDQRLLVLAKPAGMAVHGGSGVRYGIIEAVRAWRDDLPFVELVHRLDRDTSGCLVIAKRRSALRALQQALREGTVVKRYLALVRGRLERRLEVEAPLRKNQLRSGERVVRVAEDGRAARSRFVPREHFRYREVEASLVGVRIYTGRTHQIRVHAAHAGHPLAGDEKYGDPGFDRCLRSAGLRRLFLHAESLVFPWLPWAPQGLAFHAPLPGELDELLFRLRMNETS